MELTDLEKAREWAECDFDQAYIHAGPRAAAEVIRSLPDQWIDAEKVRELLDRWAANPFPTSDEVAVLNDVEAPLTPPLPTLAELVEAGNDPQQYQWMQCTVEGGDDTFVIASVRELVTKVLLPDGMHEVKGNSQVTPLPDLPKLEWPGSVPETAPGEERKENA